MVMLLLNGHLDRDSHSLNRYHLYIDGMSRILHSLQYSAGTITVKGVLSILLKADYIL